MYSIVARLGQNNTILDLVFVDTGTHSDLFEYIFRTKVGQ